MVKVLPRIETDEGVEVSSFARGLGDGVSCYPLSQQGLHADCATRCSHQKSSMLVSSCSFPIAAAPASRVDSYTLETQGRPGWPILEKRALSYASMHPLPVTKESTLFLSGITTSQ